MKRMKVVVYGRDSQTGKIWFGCPTFVSWVRHFFNADALLKIKPFKGYEQHCYYPDRFYTSMEWANMTRAYEDPIFRIIQAEEIRGRNNVEFVNRNEL